ncbi:MAG: T9SS type A sorting domain-containing protein [Bacteroidetes bacterium]|nr:T9SS type A sorting domain-containing protein [Bacteroidota bacterium]
MKPRPLLLVLFLVCVDIAMLHAQSSQELASAKEALLRDVSAMMEARVFPVMSQWKSQFEARLTDRERATLDALRERNDMLNDILTHNLRARQSAWDKRDYASFTSMRNLLRTNFDDRQKLYSELASFTERNEKPFQYLSSRIDSTVEEWRGASMRIFVDWFAKYRHVISLAMNTAASDDLARLMAACKNIRLEQLDEFAKVTFLLWDGENYLTRIRDRGIPESPLTNDSPKREQVLFVEPATPNPARGNTNIRFLLPTPGLTQARVYNANGQLMRTLLNDTLPIGKHMVTLNAGDLPAGTYYVIVEVAGLFDGVAVRFSPQ